ncbi:amino acid ABC transporter permease [Microbacterium sp. 5K110]|jgi:polar amino acid transport system permease protein|uniref:amino acid ABC transporter permease n=1 Tax=unclassified Microbacterium TaxID=2609290 RepID=UPI0010FD52BB|nr:amino acid ABC transporter permease [Microbacterium sp. 5K110]TLF30072.1 amino acid ABC transporter permease [Microbacterium sp. 5K110]
MQLFFGDLIPHAPELLNGLWISVLVTLAAVAIGAPLGVVVYLLRASELRIFRVFGASYVEIIRNTPLLLQLYLIYFALPSAGVNFDPLTAGIIALSINNSAYLAEIYRAGFEAIPRGQSEAAAALGLSRATTFWRVRVIPAMTNVLPSLTNQVILLFLASSIASIVAVPELMHVMMGITTTTFRTIETFVVGGLMYFVVALLIALASRLVEARLFPWKVA